MYSSKESAAAVAAAAVEAAEAAWPRRRRHHRPPRPGQLTVRTLGHDLSSVLFAVPAAVATGRKEEEQWAACHAALLQSATKFTLWARLVCGLLTCPPFTVYSTE